MRAAQTLGDLQMHSVQLIHSNRSSCNRDATSCSSDATWRFQRFANMLDRISTCSTAKYAPSLGAVACTWDATACGGLVLTAGLVLLLAVRTYAPCTSHSVLAGRDEACRAAGCVDGCPC
jgi:hypothetical protein